MFTHDDPEQLPEAAQSPLARIGQAPASRRTVLRRAAGVGAAGLAVAAGGGGVVAAFLSSHSEGQTATLSAADNAGDGPIFIYMAHPKSGEMEIFAGTGKTRHTNRAMASMVVSMAPH